MLCEVIRANFQTIFVFIKNQNLLKIQSKTINLKKTSTFASQTKSKWQKI